MGHSLHALLRLTLGLKSLAHALGFDLHRRFLVNLCLSVVSTLAVSATVFLAWNMGYKRLSTLRANSRSFFLTLLRERYESMLELVVLPILTVSTHL